jgi:hypothetical protein
MITLPPSRSDCLKIQGVLTFWSPRDLYRPVQGELYFYFDEELGAEIAMRQHVSPKLQKGPRWFKYDRDKL